MESLLRRALREPFRLTMAPLARSEHDAVRFSMYRHLEGAFAHLPIHGAIGQGLAISGSGYLAKMLSPQSGLRYADYPEYNMLNLPFPDNEFDFVVSDQVLEHVGGDPFQAVAETQRILKPGGIAVHATVLLYQIHGYPCDYWRFTPDGLRLLCRNFTTIIDAGGWGNRYLWALNWVGLLSTEKVPRTRWHPFHKLATINEAAYPVVTWIIAQK